MSEGRKVTLAELAKRHREARLREIATPEYAERMARLDEQARKDEEARLKWEAENKVTPHEAGRAARDSGEPREAPEDLDDTDEVDWLAGWDSLGSDKD